jgi:hypothetical protein
MSKKTAEGLLENFSKKRGRPRVIPEELMESLRGQWPDLTSDRSLNNLYHVLTASRALKADPEKYTYLFDRASGRLRKTILAELGRFEEPEVIRELADEICETRMKTAEAVEGLRFIRLYGGGASE